MGYIAGSKLTPCSEMPSPYWVVNDGHHRHMVHDLVVFFCGSRGGQQEALANGLSFGIIDKLSTAPDACFWGQQFVQWARLLW